MSHFTTIKTVIRNQVVLEDTLRSLHYNFQSGESVPIRGYQGNRTTGQVVINTGSDYDIGFQRQTDQTFAVCADWWGVQKSTAIREDEFLREVNQSYTHQNVKREVLALGHLIESEKVLENGEIEIVVCERI
jgi:hypothetical protein